MNELRSLNIRAIPSAWSPQGPRGAFTSRRAPPRRSAQSPGRGPQRGHLVIVFGPSPDLTMLAKRLRTAETSSAAVRAADGLVIVAPEYQPQFSREIEPHVSHSCLSEYIHKAVGLVAGSAGPFAGIRVV